MPLDVEIMFDVQKKGELLYVSTLHPIGCEEYTSSNFIKIYMRNNLIQEPKRKQKLGAPDFIAFRKAVKVGFIETKDLDIEFESEQIKKYKDGIIIRSIYSIFLI